MPDRRARIIHVIDSLNAGGAERVAIEIANQSYREGIAVELCVTRDQVFLADDLLPNTPLHVLKRRWTWDLVPIWKFVRYCFSFETLILHAHGRSSMMFCVLVKTLLPGRIRLVFHDHSSEIDLEPFALLRLRIACRFWVDKYVGVDTNLQNWAVDKLGLPADKTHTVANSIDLRPYEEIQQNKPEKLDFQPVSQPLLAAFVATLAPVKNQALVIEALAQSKIAKDKLHILFVGQLANHSYVRQCKDLIRERELENNFTFLGVRKDVPLILYSVDYGLLGSNSESGPVALLEYMAAGLPFIVTNTGEITRQVRAKQHGLFVDIGDPAAYASALDELVTITDQKKSVISTGGWGIIKSQFSIVKQFAQLAEIYSELM